MPLIHAELRVVGTAMVTPHMRRLTLAGPGLAGYTPAGPDQQVKLFFSRDGGPPRIPAPPPELAAAARWMTEFRAMPDAVRPWMRSYTVRRHLPDAEQVEIDFALHGNGGPDGAGPATRWAADAGPGDVVGLYGPSVGNRGVSLPSDWQLLVGDETALPAMGALVEALPAGRQALVVAEVADAAEEQRWESEGTVQTLWVHRGSTPPGRSTALVDAVRAAELPGGAMAAWVAGEASVVRAVRRHLVGERGVDRRSVAFTGYWRHGADHDHLVGAGEDADGD